MKQPNKKFLAALLEYANATPKVLSLLYDLDLMPEQTMKTPSAYNQTLNVVLHCRAIQADALRHAASECGGRIDSLKHAAYNVACHECAISIEAEAERLEASHE